MRRIFTQSSETLEPERPGSGGTDIAVVTRTREKTEKPPLFKVLLLNDDFTPMEFVIDVLERFFSMPHASAVSVMRQVHKKGVGLAGIFTHEVAAWKADQVEAYAVKNEYPLKARIERDDGPS